MFCMLSERNAQIGMIFLLLFFDLYTCCWYCCYSSHEDSVLQLREAVWKFLTTKVIRFLIFLQFLASFAFPINMPILVRPTLFDVKPSYFLMYSVIV
eukprot:UN14837